MFIPAALHGAEAILVSERNLCRLRSAFVRAAWSGRLSLANPRAVLPLLDGPLGSDPALHVVWCRFRMKRRFLAYMSSVLDISRIYRFLGEEVAGASGHGLVHLLVQIVGLVLPGILSSVSGSDLVFLALVSLPLRFIF